MNFKIFDMDDYFNLLEEFKATHNDKVVKLYGSVENYNEHIQKLKAKKNEISKMAIERYGSIENYAKSMKKNLDCVLLSKDPYEQFHNDCLEDNHPKLKKLYEKLVSNLSKDPHSKEIQQIATEITNISKNDYEFFKTDIGDNNWYYMVQRYLTNPKYIDEIDKKYGKGASKFIGESFKNNLGCKAPKSITLYEKLTSDINKDPYSKEIQEIVEEMVNETRKQNEVFKIAEGENHWSYMAEHYLSDSNLINATDNKYGIGASKFMGKAFKFYSENTVIKFT